MDGPLVTQRGAWTSSVGMNGAVTVPEGYHNGAGKVNGPPVTQRGAPTAYLNCGDSYGIADGYYSGGRVYANSLASQTGGVSAEDGYVYNGKTYWKNGVKRTGNMAVNSLLSFSAAAYGGKQILLKWQNPYAATGKPFSGVEIRYSTGGYPGAGGTVIYTGTGNNTAAGGWSQALVTMPALGTGYYFSARPYITTSLGTLYGDVINRYAATAAELWLTFTSSQSYVLPAGYSRIDIFAVGGGGGTAKNSSTGASHGAGSGYTKQLNGIGVSPGDSISIVIGLGGVGAADGSPSIVSKNGSGLINAPGGTGVNATGKPGTGGSGGGCSNSYDSSPSNKYYSGNGGSNGSDGYLYGKSSGVESFWSNAKGQGTTTRAWGSGTLYSGAGGAGNRFNTSSYRAGLGGEGGGGNGSSDYSSSPAGANGSPNTGGGAGGCHYPPSGTVSANGGSGIVLLHVY